VGTGNLTEGDTGSDPVSPSRESGPRGVPVTIVARRNGQGTVHIGNEDVSDVVTRLAIFFDPDTHSSVAVIGLDGIDAADIDCNGFLKVTDRARTALMALGWRPPATEA